MVPRRKGLRCACDKETRWERKVDVIRIIHHEIMVAYSNEIMIGGYSKQITYKMMGRKKPAKDWLKLNVDGSVQGPERRASAGGLIGDEYGKWLQRFKIILVCCLMEEAELWAI